MGRDVTNHSLEYVYYRKMSSGETVVLLTINNTLAHNVFWRVRPHLLYKAIALGSLAATKPIHKTRILESMRETQCKKDTSIQYNQRNNSILGVGS